MMNTCICQKQNMRHNSSNDETMDKYINKILAFLPEIKACQILWGGYILF